MLKIYLCTYYVASLAPADARLIAATTGADYFGRGAPRAPRRNLAAQLDVLKSALRPSKCDGMPIFFRVGAHKKEKRGTFIIGGFWTTSLNFK